MYLRESREDILLGHLSLSDRYYYMKLYIYKLLYTLNYSKIILTLNSKNLFAFLFEYVLTHST